MEHDDRPMMRSADDTADDTTDDTAMLGQPAREHFVLQPAVDPSDVSARQHHGAQATPCVLISHLVQNRLVRGVRLDAEDANGAAPCGIGRA
jgi:hypothetical protein